MDNRLNELRRKISALRLKMRQELTVQLSEWSLLGGGERLPVIQERLRGSHRAVQRPKAQAKQKVAKRRLTARW